MEGWKIDECSKAPDLVSHMTVTNMPTLNMGDYMLVFVERGSNSCLLTALPGSQIMAQVSIVPATTVHPDCSSINGN